MAWCISGKKRRSEGPFSHLNQKNGVELATRKFENIDFQNNARSDKVSYLLSLTLNNIFMCTALLCLMYSILNLIRDDVQYT